MLESILLGLGLVVVIYAYSYLITGVWITTVMYSLAHVITTQSIGNAFTIFVYFFFLGLIYRYTKNAIRPTLGRLLINGMVWAFITIPWK